MRRLTSRTQRERGSSTIVVAVSFMALLGFVGLGIDVSGAFAKRQEAQNGADAAAIAVASQCLLNQTAVNCPEDYASARTIALANELTGDTATVETGHIEYDTPDPFHVTVTVTAQHDSWFLPATVTDSNFTVRRSATVNYGSPVEGTVTIPIAAADCIFPESLAPDEVYPVEIWLPQNSSDTHEANDCNPNYPAGGFTWLDGEDCTAEVTTDPTSGLNTIPSSPGSNAPARCHQMSSDMFADMARDNKTAFIPLFEVASGSGANAVYVVTRFAVFEVTGFHYQQGNLNNWGTQKPVDPLWCKNPPPWIADGNWGYNNTTCFAGNLLGFLDDPGEFELGGPITEINFMRLVG